MATHFSILAWKNPMDREPGGLQSMGSQRVEQDLVIKQQILPLARLPLHSDGRVAIPGSQWRSQDPATIALLNLLLRKLPSL